MIRGLEPAVLVEQAMQVLECVGVLFEDAEARELLGQAGASTENGRTRFPARLVLQALESAPRAFSLFDREGGPAMELGTGRTYFNPGSAALHVLDAGQRRRRRATTSDCVALVQRVEGLRHYSAQSTALVPEDVPEEVSDRYRLYLALTYGRKPVVTGAFRVESLEPMAGMLRAVRGGSQALADKPLAVFDCCPSPPLRWSHLSCRTLLWAAAHRLPVNLVGVPLAGATSPVTLREALLQQCAENLAGLTLLQLAEPGTPAIYGGAPAAFDMRYGTAPFAAPESILMNAAAARLAAHLGLPSHGYLALSDSKLPDYQAGMETAAGAVAAVLAGVNLVSGPGLLDYALTQSPEKLLLDHEACGLALRLARGVSEQHHDVLALFTELVERGGFLASPHTRKHWRQELEPTSPLIERRSHGDWENSGSPDAAERAAQVPELPEPLPSLAPELERQLRELAQTDS